MAEPVFVGTGGGTFGEQPDDGMKGDGREKNVLKYLLSWKN